ncbi:MAG: hypothetical protein KAS63_01965 [Candidatus Heimdallarchaeota archaeon]|nr:hypothetical protein [Candidatus Heimdallarchaeota archaeon]MCK4954101.1 hypothetical protein [Candidatus Heimdallarchaeota archaeon]
MNNSNKIMVLGLLTLMFIASIGISVSAIPPDTRMENREGSVYFETPDILVKLHAGKPDIFFWARNRTDNEKKIAVFHVSFHFIAELFGDDLVIDDRTELNGKMYNLASSIIEWDLTVENFTNEIRATQTSSALDNGATITFVYHIYYEDTVVTQQLDENTTITYNAKALTEVKFDIIVDNWNFSEGATGLVFHVKIHEMKYLHRVQNGDRINVPEEDERRNTTEEMEENRSQDPSRHGIEFYNDKDVRTGYFAWTPEADVFDENGTYIDTINATASATSYGFDQRFGNSRNFGREFINLFLVYPNYGNGNTLVHDPVIGIDDTQKTSASWISLAAIPVITFALIAIQRRRK